MSFKQRNSLQDAFNTHKRHSHGLFDAILALQWVNDNIEYFGGDKNKIAISGESAGAISVSILCVSPLTKGLFTRAILQSGTTIAFKESNLGYNLNLGQEFAEKVGCATNASTIYNDPKKVVHCLRTKDATYLAENLWTFVPLSTTAFLPQYGDTLLPNNPLESLQNGNFHNVPILAGNNKDEGSLFVTTANPDEFGFFGQKDPKVNKTYARTLLQGAFAAFPDQQKYIDFYLKGVPDEDYDLIRRQAYTAYGDTLALCDTLYFAESYAKRGNDAFYYFFTHRPSNSPWAKWMGVAHYEEVQFVFGRPIRVRKEYKLDEVTLSKKVIKIWATFTKTGRPPAYPKWPKYTKENHTYFTIDVKGYGKLGTGPHLESCDFLRSYYGF